VEALTYLDTHVVVWLYAGLMERFPPSVRERLEGPLAVSPVVELELQYLFEVGRTTVAAEEVISDLRSRIGIETADASLIAVVDVARELSWTRDPFDRLISAQAINDDVPLLTADETLLEHLDFAIWEG
jgi:PIN domain nuclease of toxin-antitoxin system